MRTRILVAFVVVVALVAGLMLLNVERDGGRAGRAGPAAQDIPIPKDLDELDPMVREAVLAALDALGASPRDPRKWFEMGMVYEANSLPYEAGDCYERSLRLGGTESRIKQRLAFLAYHFNDLDQATSLMREAGELEPSYAPIHWRRGIWHLEKGELEEAEAAFVQSIRVQQTDAGGWYGMVRLRLMQDRGGEIIEWLEAQPQDGPVAPYTRSLLRRAYLQAGEHEKAENIIGEVNPEPPLWPDLWTAEVVRRATGTRLLLDRAGELHRRGEFAEMLAIADSVLLHNTDLTDARTARAGALFGLGRFDEGIAELETVVKLLPQDVTPRLNLAKAMRALGRHDDAVAAIEGALLLRPESDELETLRKEILMERDRATD